MIIKLFENFQNSIDLREYFTSIQDSCHSITFTNHNHNGLDLQVVDISFHVKDPKTYARHERIYLQFIGEEDPFVSDLVSIMRDPHLAHDQYGELKKTTFIKWIEKSSGCKFYIQPKRITSKAILDRQFLTKIGLGDTCPISYSIRIDSGDKFLTGKIKLVFTEK